MATCWRMLFAMPCWARRAWRYRDAFSGHGCKVEGREQHDLPGTCKKLLDEKHFAIEHVDAVVITGKAEVGPHFRRWREALGESAGRQRGKRFI